VQRSPTPDSVGTVSSTSEAPMSARIFVILDIDATDVLNVDGCVNVLTTFCDVLCDHFTEKMRGNMGSVRLLIKMYLAP